MIEVIDSIDIDSPFIERITHGYSCSEERVIRPSETNSHIVISKRHNKNEIILVGPWDTALPLLIESDVEMIWIRLRVGIQMAKTPTRAYTYREVLIPNFSSTKAILNESILCIPDFRNTDGFLDRLNQIGFFKRDPLVENVLAGNSVQNPSRTVRKHYLDMAGI